MPWARGCRLRPQSASFSVQVTTSMFAVSAALRLAGAIAMIIGFTALYLPAADRAGRFGMVAYFLTVANLVLQAGWMWADLFITGAFAANAPGVLDGTVDDGRRWVLASCSRGCSTRPSS